MPRHTSKTSGRVLPRPARKTRGRIAPDGNYDDWLAQKLQDPAEAAAYLQAAIDEGDQPALMLALRRVAQSRGGVARLAGTASLTREATYRMLSAKGNPELRSFTAILSAAGLRLLVEPAKPKQQRKRELA